MNTTVMRRLFHFCPPSHVLENINNNQLKVSRFSDCNDPFELAAFSLKNKNVRTRHKKWLADTDKKHGLICFCRNWRNPVLWSHYADNHRGLCLGFDVSPEKYVDVRYASERLYPEINSRNFLKHIGEDQMADIFATKFIHWSYEEEVRLLITFETEPENGEICFYPYSDELRLRQIIIGPRSDISVEDIYEAVGDSGIKVFQARLGFKRFEVVRQKNKKLWNYR
ncbi:MAG: DUF2971 domain-containing protein [Planctomycetaceae bacterium]|nr:DUF2971 domain-containing protein [Planctomycetaceae bacterium]